MLGPSLLRHKSIDLIYLSLLRAVEGELDIVHRSLGVDHAAQEPLEALEPEEARGEACAEGRARAQLIVEREQRVEQGGPRARVTQDEERPRVDALTRDGATVTDRLDGREERVESRKHRHEGRTLPIGSPLDVRPEAPEQRQPLAKADAADGVVLEAPALCRREAGRRLGEHHHPARCNEGREARVGTSPTRRLAACRTVINSTWKHRTRRRNT